MATTTKIETWKVTCRNLAGNEFVQWITAPSAESAKQIVLKRNKYLTVISVESDSMVDKAKER